MVTEHNVLQTTIRKSPPSSDLHFFHLIYSSASKPTTLPRSLPSHPPLHRKPAPVCRHTFGIMLHVQANCAAKGIISVHCRRPVNQSSLCYRQRALPSHPTHTRIPSSSSIHAVSFPCAHLQCASRAGSYTHPQLIFSSPGPHGPIEPRPPPVAYTGHPVRHSSVRRRLVSQCSQNG